MVTCSASHPFTRSNMSGGSGNCDVKTNAATILVVDDDREMASILVEIVSAAGLPHDRRHSGADALARGAATILDLVISDLRMVGMSGHQLQVEIRRMAPDLPV